MKGLVMAMRQWEKLTWSSVNIPWIRTSAVDRGSRAFTVGAGVGSGIQGSGADGMGGGWSGLRRSGAYVSGRSDGRGVQSIIR